MTRIYRTGKRFFIGLGKRNPLRSRKKGETISHWIGKAFYELKNHRKFRR